MNPKDSPLLTAEGHIEIMNELYLQSVRALEQADRIAETTDSLRAIATAAQLRKELRDLVTDRQAYLSKQILVEDGIWDQIFADKVSYHISVITGEIPKQQEKE